MEWFSEFVEGPLLWASFIIFIVGSLYRIIAFFSLSSKRDKVVYQHFSLGAVIKTWLRYIFPFNQTVKKTPVFSIAGYLFHLCLLIVPLFCVAHLNEWEEGYLWASGIFEWSALSWAWIPEGWTPVLTWIVIVIGAGFLLRRMVLPEVKILTEASDYLVLLVTVLPFLTGFLASHTAVLGDYGRLIHILAGELMLILIPLTKLSHFLLFFPSRMVMGIEWNRRGYSA